MASSILVPHNTFPKEQKGRKKDKEIWGWVSKGAKGQERKKKKVELDFTVKGICAACRHFCWNHLQSMKQESCFFFKFKFKLGSI